MEYSKFGISGFLFTLCIYQINCDTINTRPTNQVVLSGGQAVFNCSITFANTDGDAHRWQRLLQAGTTFKTIFQSFPKDFEYDRNKFTIDNPDPNTYNVIVKNVNIMDAGTYSCTGIISTDTSALAELVVIERPVVTLYPTNIKDGDQVKMMCDVKYAGSKQNSPEIKPDVKAMLGWRDITNIATIKRVEGDLGTEAASRISLTVNQTVKKEHHGGNFTCQVTTNTPRFEISQNRTLNIGFAQEVTLAIQPDGRVHTRALGHSIVFTCTATGLSQDVDPRLEWYDQEDRPVTDRTGRIFVEYDNPQEKRLYVRDIEARDSGTFTCKGTLNGNLVSKQRVLKLFMSGLQCYDCTHMKGVVENKDCATNPEKSPLINCKANCYSEGIRLAGSTEYDFKFVRGCEDSAKPQKWTCKSNPKAEECKYVCDTEKCNRHSRTYLPPTVNPSQATTVPELTTTQHPLTTVTVTDPPHTTTPQDPCKKSPTETVFRQYAGQQCESVQKWVIDCEGGCSQKMDYCKEETQVDLKSFNCPYRGRRLFNVTVINSCDCKPMI